MSGCGFYTIDLEGDGEPVRCTDVLEWGRWMSTANRTLQLSYLHSERYGMVCLSTIFLGVDHSFGGREPVLFESMVFREKGTDKFGDVPPDDNVAGRGLWGEQRRYTTRAAALAGHGEILAALISATKVEVPK